MNSYEQIILQQKFASKLRDVINLLESMRKLAEDTGNVSELNKMIRQFEEWHQYIFQLINPPKGYCSKCGRELS